MSQGVENTELQTLPEAVFELTGLAPITHNSKSTYPGLEYTYPKSTEASIFLDDIFWLSVLFLIVPIITYIAYAWGKWKGRKESPKEKAIEIFNNSEKKNPSCSREDESTNSQDSDDDASPSKRSGSKDVHITDENQDMDLPEKKKKKKSQEDSYSGDLPFPKLSLNLNQDGSISNSPADVFSKSFQDCSNEKSNNEELTTVSKVYHLDQPVPISVAGKQVYRYQESKYKPEDPDLNERLFGEKVSLTKDPSEILEKEGKVEVHIEPQPDGTVRKVEKTEVTTIYSNVSVAFPFIQYNSNEVKSICDSSNKSISENSQPVTIFSHMDSNERKAQSKTPSIPTQSQLDRVPSHALVAVTRSMSDTTGHSSNIIPKARNTPNRIFELDESQTNIKEVDEFIDKFSNPPVKKINSEPLEKSLRSITKSTRADSKSKPEDEKTLHLQRLEKEYDLPHETGKFERIFKSPESIGSGSFGEVFRVVHRVDGKLYAVKKVKLRFGRIDDLQKESKVFREVFAMTDLHHPNIVRYSTCWVEVDYINPEDKNRRAQSLEDISESSESEPSYCEDNDDREASENYDMIQFGDSKAGDSQIVFDRSQVGPKPEQSKSRNLNRRNQKKHSSKILKTLTKSIKEDEEDSYASQSHSIMSNYSNISKIDPRFKHCRLYLYIQMEFCSGSSLRTYLDNPRREVHVPTVLEMFHKLLEGVRMIHSHNILHRDLKPANIFLDEHNNVKIGDFGLASLSNFEDEISENNKGLNLFTNKKSGLNRSLKVGTPLYTSPEQERGGSYDSKTDIYSLGLIFCEMLCVFGTTHERYQTLTRLREHHEVPEKIFDRYEAYSGGLKEIILNMTQKAPADRPTAEVLMKDVDKLRGK